jgi:hypothetical protein
LKPVLFFLPKGGYVMLPVFLVEETTVRESGESAIFDASGHSGQNLLLTFGITHAIERESIGLDIQGSKDGLSWSPEPIVSFSPKFYCGTYQVILSRCEAQYLRAVWRVLRWSRADRQPLFRFYILAQPVRAGAMAAGA